MSAEAAASPLMSLIARELDVLPLAERKALVDSLLNAVCAEPVRAVVNSWAVDLAITLEGLEKGQLVFGALLKQGREGSRS